MTKEQHRPPLQCACESSVFIECIYCVYQKEPSGYQSCGSVPEGTIWLSIVRFSTRMNHLVINRAVLYQIFIFIYRMVLCQREFEQTSQLLYKNPKTNRFRPAGAVPSKDDFQCLVLKSKGQTSEVLTAVRQYSYYFIIFT